MNWSEVRRAAGLDDAGLGFVRDTTRPPGEHLVEAAPPHLRAALRAEIDEAFGQYTRLAARFGLPADDVAAAVAAFVAGHVMAWRDIDFPDAGFVALVAQMRRLMAANPGYRAATDAERQRLHEEMAILGMQMAAQRAALEARPDPQAGAAMRKEAKLRLDRFLQRDSTPLAIDENGLKVVLA